MSFVPRQYQTEAVDAAVEYFQSKGKQHAIEILPTGCHQKGTYVLMFNGDLKKVEDVEVGDILMGPDSQPREVIRLCRGVDNMFRITPLRGGNPFVVNGEHILSLASTRESNNKEFPCVQKGGERTFISVYDYLNKSKSFKHLRKLERVSVVEFSTKELPIVPYVLGCLLGDGCFRNGIVSMTTEDREIIEVFQDYVDDKNLRIRISDKPGTNAKALSIVKKIQVRNPSFENHLMRRIRYLGLDGADSSTKFIPNIYKTGDRCQRLDILAGLLDTDGSLGIGGYDFISKSETLAADTAFVARSLGFSVSESVEHKHDQNGRGGLFHRLHISGHTNLIPCRIARKKAQPRRQKKNHLVSGFCVEEVGQGEFFGFELSGDHLYLTGDFVIHHNSGKSVVIANIASRLDGKVLILQPSKEILEQNFAKYSSYGFRAGIYSASAGVKYKDNVTFAMIGSIIKKRHLFEDFQYIIIDECHLVNSKGGMYNDFIRAFDKVKVLGLTATPYRLSSSMEGAMLKFLTRTSPRIFSKVLYFVQNNVLFDAGHLAPLEYYRFNVIDRNMLTVNSTGADFTDASLKAYYRKIDMPKTTTQYANRLLAKRNSLLVFCSLLEEAWKVSQGVPGSVVVSGDTDPVLRKDILSRFKAGKIRCVINVGVLTTGFDYPELEAVLIARSTMSLALYYQIIGRVMRPFTYEDGSKKTGWVVDLGGNIEFFGKIETMQIRQNEKGLYSIWNNGRQLTNVPFTKS